MGWLVTATCIFLGRTIWIRRWTLLTTSEHAHLTERTITTSLVLQLAALFLGSPLSRTTIGWLLHAAFGHWNLDVWAGNCCYIGAAGMMSVNVSSRLNISTDELRARFKQRFELPITAISAVLLGLLVQSPNADRYWADFMDCPPDVWLDLYWTLLNTYLIYLLVGIIGGLLILYNAPHNRRTASFYIAGCLAAVAACVDRIVSSWIDAEGCGKWMWLGGCAASVYFSYGAARSWRKKVSWLEGQRRAVDL